MSSRRADKKVHLRVQQNAIGLARNFNQGVPLSKRARGGGRNRTGPFLPPEDWYEPSEKGDEHFRIVVKPPGAGYRHVLTPDEIHHRLSKFPPYVLRALEVIQFSTMTQKKRTFPCYGMQWGASIYLYPIEEGLIEHFDHPPKPAVYNEAQMYGGRWEQTSTNCWRLIWTEEAIRDFYLNNILIHELGHLVDNRNTRDADRERFAEWFAIRHGYKASERARLARRVSRVKRRHHAC